MQIEIVVQCDEQGKENIDTSIIEKEEEIHLFLCNRVWMKNVLIHSLICYRD